MSRLHEVEEVQRLFPKHISIDGEEVLAQDCEARGVVVVQ